MIIDRLITDEHAQKCRTYNGQMMNIFTGEATNNSSLVDFQGFAALASTLARATAYAR